eukprot:gnl/TRDRNA2_/TRDRNA2_179691_c0_seq1.p1 gnl/TRDRNA2_/TRDRNA2_179691_c0~~gnl/TRDRNA2_/TRDRNA2_179691_c0_seq1.p1  ORF type:complete len:531 (+),score=112.82 gnl/TRDRNA2_/TRDRNA2_179691_c0_seq1:63-1655(+)
MAPSPAAPAKPAMPAKPESFRRHKFNSIEDQLRHAAWTPDPQSYDVCFNMKSMSGGRISKAHLPSALDMPAKLVGFVPGPGQYDTPDLKGFPLPDGGRMRTVATPPRLDLKAIEYPQPAPGHYGIPNADLTHKRLARAGAFGKDPKVSKAMVEEEKRTRGIPAPGAHEVIEAFEYLKPFCPEGGKFSEAKKPDFYTDAVAKLSEDKPGPTSYEKPGALKIKQVGRLVYKYESSTMAESKKLIEKVCGPMDKPPGPGTYEPKDPHHKAPDVPALRGRTLPFAMPHPFCYNCKPDYASKFEPVRKQNSGDQIYGRRGARRQQPKDGWKPQSPAQVELIQAQELPAADHINATSHTDVEGVRPEDVQWRSGGFQHVLKKAASTPSFRGPVHSSVEEAAKHYQVPLARKHGRHHKTFMPMSQQGHTRDVPTHDDSKEYVHIKSYKWHMNSVADGLQSASTSIMQPLDEAGLRAQAEQSLLDKARNAMNLEGISKDRQELILAELPQVIAEHRGAKSVSTVCGSGEVPPADDPLF